MGIEYDESTGDSIARLEFISARQAYEQGNLESALELLQSSQRREPHFKTLFMTARVLRYLGRDQEAHGALAEA